MSQQLLEEEDISRGEIGGFLARVKGQNVPQSDWPQVMGELTRQYSTLGARIEATPVTHTQSQVLVKSANTAHRKSQLEEAGRLLQEASTGARMHGRIVDWRAWLLR
jgi:hypothetical protein